MFLLLLLPLPGRAGDGGAFRAALRSTQSEITNIVPPPVGSSQGLPSSRPTGTLGDFQLQSQHSDGAGAALPARNIVFKKQSAAREMAGGGKRRDAHLSLAEQRRGSSKHAALRAGESTGSYKLLINVG